MNEYLVEDVEGSSTNTNNIIDAGKYLYLTAMVFILSLNVSLPGA